MTKPSYAQLELDLAEALEKAVKFEFLYIDYSTEVEELQHERMLRDEEIEALRADRDRLFEALKAIIEVQDNSDKMYSIAREALAPAMPKGES